MGGRRKVAPGATIRKGSDTTNEPNGENHNFMNNTMMFYMMNWEASRGVIEFRFSFASEDFQSTHTHTHTPQTPNTPLLDTA